MPKRKIFLDLLKIVLAVFVVLIHCNFLGDYNHTINFLTAQGVFRISVPIFFIINGYYFKNVIENKKLKNWVVRVAILYFLWTLIYSPIWFDFSIKSLIRNIFLGYHHLWYIKAMIFCGLSLYFMNRIKHKKLLIIAIMLFMFGVIIQYLGNYHVFTNAFFDKWTNSLYAYRNFVFFGLPFFILGYLINVTNWEKTLTKKQIILLITAGSTLLLVESYLNYMNTNQGMDTLFLLILVSPLVFIYALNIQINNKFDSKKVALMSTAIYLIHPWIMHICYLYLIKNTLSLSVITIVASIGISMVLIKINTKLKFLL